MEKSLLKNLFICFSLFLIGCQSNKTAFTFRTQSEPKPIAASKPDTLPQQQFAKSALPEKQAPKTVAFSAPKVKTLTSLVLPKPNVNSAASSKTIPSVKFRKQAIAQKIKEIKDEPVKGPARTFSGIFLALGMALLLVAGVLFLIGTSGAGLLAWIGGGSFLIGAILAIVSLLSY